MKFTHKINGKLLPLLLIVLLGLTACVSQSPGVDESRVMHWLEDKSGTMTLHEVSKKDLSSQWKIADKASPNFGFTDTTVWLSLPFVNPNAVATSMLLEMAFPLHDKIDVFLLDGDKVVKGYLSGDEYPFRQRPIEHRNYLFPYTLEPNQALRAIVRVQTSDAMYLPVKVWQANAFFQQDQHQLLLIGLFFGFLSIMLVYNLLLYFSTHHKSYLYYVGYTASVIYLQLIQKGVGFQYFWPGEMLFNHLSVPVANYCLGITSLFFILNFLDLKPSQYPATIKTFRSFIWISLAAFAATAAMIMTDIYLVSYQVLLITTVVLGLTITMTTLVLLARLSFKGNHSAQLLLVAWMSLLIGICLFALGRVGVPMPMWLSENAMMIGSTFEAALISFALARHIKREREARMSAQKLALRNERQAREAQHSLLALQKDTTHQLEREVQERTQKLESAMHELTAANHKLDNLARLDSLTGLSNRWNFEQAFNTAWAGNQRLKQPMSLLMADIDHFKQINDTYGHMFGDKCLTKVAKVLKLCVGQSGNLAARFGGEEFIIMLPNTGSKNAAVVGERVRANIEKITMMHEGKPVQFTISVGIATVIPTVDIAGACLNEHADQALYQAKESGRNRVVAIDLSSKAMRETA